MATKIETLDILFDGPPGPESPRFIEVERQDGTSIGVGEWIEKANGWWALRLRVATEESPAPKAGIVTALALFLGLAFGACATARPAPVPVETVGVLAPSYRSIATAPVHAGTDLSVAYQAVSGDDDGPAVADVGDRDVKPEVAAKGGLTMGGVR